MIKRDHTLKVRTKCTTKNGFSTCIHNRFAFDVQILAKLHLTLGLCMQRQYNWVYHILKKTVLCECQGTVSVIALLLNFHHRN